MNREKFEALPFVDDKLESIYFCEELGCYTEKKGYKFCSISSWVNGAYDSFCEQQKKIEKISDQIDSLISESELWGFDSNQALRQLEIIQELLK